jgi:ribonucleoside-diphosphate reductase alpha chain
MINNGYDINTEKVTQDRGACPECGWIVEHEGGCSVCHVCGYSECA